MNSWSRLPAAAGSACFRTPKRALITTVILIFVIGRFGPDPIRLALAQLIASVIGAVGPYIALGLAFVLIFYFFFGRKK